MFSNYQWKGKLIHFGVFRVSELSLGTVANWLWWCLNYVCLWATCRWDYSSRHRLTLCHDLHLRIVRYRWQVIHTISQIKFLFPLFFVLLVLLSESFYIWPLYHLFLPFSCSNTAPKLKDEASADTFDLAVEPYKANTVGRIFSIVGLPTPHYYSNTCILQMYVSNELTLFCVYSEV